MKQRVSACYFPLLTTQTESQLSCNQAVAQLLNVGCNLQSGKYMLMLVSSAKHLDLHTVPPLQHRDLF